MRDFSETGPEGDNAFIPFGERQFGKKMSRKRDKRIIWCSFDDFS
jgi:hypothetical protein